MNPTIETLERRDALGIRRQVAMAEIGEKMGELIAALMAVAAPHMAGPILTRWLSWGEGTFDMEVAVPVRGLVEGRGDVQATTLPGGPALVLMHVGPYETVKESWMALDAWMKEQGKEGRDAPWEEYIDDPRIVPAAELRTQIVWPIQ